MAITSESRNELDARITPAAAVVIASSYEMICALERIPPISENLLFEAQPARTMAYTESDVMAKMYRTPIERSAPSIGMSSPPETWMVEP